MIAPRSAEKLRAGDVLVLAGSPSATEAVRQRLA
jgi:hypothetical protein